MYEMAERMVIARYNLTRLMDRIEAAGGRALPLGRRPPRHLRAAHAGRALRREMWKVYGPAIDELFLSQLPESQQDAMAEQFRHIARHVRALSRSKAG